jgi:hypothetical protein
VYLKASLEVDGIPVPVTLRNLSAEGALVEGECLPPEGATTRFQREKLRVKARVAWVHDRLAGIAFDRDLKREDVLRHVPTPSPQPLPACRTSPRVMPRIAVELLDDDLVSGGDAILLPARAHDCEHWLFSSNRISVPARVWAQSLWPARKASRLWQGATGVNLDDRC